TYHKLGLLEAERHLQKAVDLRRAALGPQDLRTLAAQEELANFFVQSGRKYEAGEALGRETWQARQRALGPDHRETLQSLETYAFALANQKKLAEAQPLMRQCFEARERTLGPLSFDTIDCLGNLAYVLATAGDFAQAERYEREELLRYEKLGLTNRTEALY